MNTLPKNPMQHLFDGAVHGDRRLRIALGGTLLLCALAGMYYVNVLKPAWLREEVTTYVNSTALPVNLAATENTRKAAHSVGQFIYDKKSHTEAFVDELRERADIAKDEATRAKLVHELFTRHFFTEQELAQAVDAAVEAHYKALTEAANTLARRIAEEYPYELTQRAGVNAQAVKVNYEQMVDYTRSLHDSEAWNYLGTMGVSFAAEALTTAIGGRVAENTGYAAKSGGLWALVGGHPWVAALALVIGGGTALYLNAKQRKELIIATNTMLDKTAAKLDGDLEKAMAAHTDKQLSIWQDGLTKEIIAYRENL
jgi:hypothetical protein